MTDELRNQAWALLPEDFKRVVREKANVLGLIHIRNGQSQFEHGALSMLKNLFGLHNLAAEEQPRESDIDGKFHVGDKVVTVNFCPLYGKGWIGAVIRCHESDVDVEFVGRSSVNHVPLCDLEPYTEEQPKPKFKVGDKVKALTLSRKGKVGEIIGFDEEDRTWRVQFPLPDYIVCYPEEDLEPYTSESDNISQNVSNCDKCEDKELNLCELLKGCEGMEFYSKWCGKCYLKSINPDGTNFTLTYNDGKASFWLLPKEKLQKMAN